MARRGGEGEGEGVRSAGVGRESLVLILRRRTARNDDTELNDPIQKHVCSGDALIQKEYDDSRDVHRRLFEFICGLPLGASSSRTEAAQREPARNGHRTDEPVALLEP